MADEELGTKRVCPETGKKFYDLGKDPIVSPYTGKEYSVAFFEGEPVSVSPSKARAEEAPKKEAAISGDDELEDEDADLVVSLEDLDEDDADSVDDDDPEDIPDIPDVDVDLDDDDVDDDDAFLDDDEEDSDLSDVIVSSEKEEEL